MGIVLAASDPRSGAKLAVKVLTPGASPETRERFEVEYQAQLRVRHPAVARVLDRGQTSDGLPYLVFERFEGEPLSERLRRGPLPQRDAAQLIAELAEGLTACHAVGVLHRDLKPDNVLLSDAGPRLIDFGLALERDAAERLTRTGALMGSPGYWAPELARGDKTAVGPATDVYGLGALLYACLTSHPPHSGTSIQELAHAAAYQAVDPPTFHVPDLDRELVALCLTCLAGDPAQRSPGAQHVAQALRAWLSGPPPETPSRAGRGQSPLALAGAALAGLALVAAGLGAWVLSGGEAPDTSEPHVAEPSRGVEVPAGLADELAAARESREWGRIEQLLADVPRPLPPALAFEEAYVDLLLGRGERALATLEAQELGALDEPLASRTRALLSAALGRACRWDEATDVVDALADDPPDDWLTLRLLARSLQERASVLFDTAGVDARLASLWRRAIDAGDTSLATRANVLWKQAGGPEKREALERLYAEHPDHPRVLHVLASDYAYQAPAQWPRALELVERLNEVAGDDPYLVLAAAHLASDGLRVSPSIDAARVVWIEERLDRALTLAPRDPVVLTQIANVLRLLGERLQAQGQQARAHQCFEHMRDRLAEALDLYPDCYRAQQAWLHAIANLEGPEPALAEVDRLLRTHPQDYELHYLRYLYLLELGRGAEALEAVEAAARLGPPRFRVLAERVRSRLGR